MCESYGVVRENKKRQAHMKPSDALREKKKVADRRRKKGDRKDSAYASGKI
jgi:ribosomal protein S21